MSTMPTLPIQMARDIAAASQDAHVSDAFLNYMRGGSYDRSDVSVRAALLAIQTVRSLPGSTTVGLNPDHVYAVAEANHYANLLTEMRDQLAIFVDELEDEGDRVYFGSSNHAAYLRDTEEKLRYLDWERTEMAAVGRDLIAEIRARNVALHRIDAEAPSQEPSATPTVGFPASADPEQDDGNGVVREAFLEGVARGRWEAAVEARKLLVTPA